MKKKDSFLGKKASVLIRDFPEEPESSPRGKGERGNERVGTEVRKREKA